MACHNFESINVTEWTGEECFDWANTVSENEGVFLQQDVLSTFMAISGNDLLIYSEVDFESLVSSYASIFHWHFQQLKIDRGIGISSLNESGDYGLPFENVYFSQLLSIDEDTSSNIMVNHTDVDGSQPSPSPTHSFSNDKVEEEVANTEKCEDSIKCQASLEDLLSTDIPTNILLQNPSNFGDLAYFISGHPIQQNSEQQKAFSSLSEYEDISSDSGIISAIESDNEFLSEDPNSPQPLCIDEDIKTEPEENNVEFADSPSSRCEDSKQSPSPTYNINNDTVQEDVINSKRRGLSNVNYSDDIPSEETQLPQSKDLMSVNTLPVANGRKKKRKHKIKGLPNVSFSDDIPSEEIHLRHSKDLTSDNKLSVARGRKSKMTRRTKGVSSVDSGSKLSTLEVSSSLSSLQMPFTTGIDVFQRIMTKNRNRDRGPRCWEFLMRLLVDFNSNPSLIKWEDKSKHTFRFVRPNEVAEMWGTRSRRHISYVHFARDLRYHYRTGALRDVSDKKLVYGCGEKAVRYLHQMYKQHLKNEEIS